MPLLVADCPRCGAAAITFDVKAHEFLWQKHNWLNTHEVFSVCRQCHQSSVFLVSLSLSGRDHFLQLSEKISSDPDMLMNYPDALNDVFDVVRFISVRDHATVNPPEHLPDNIRSIFEEGAACHSIGCNNAAACMFRLCLDLVSSPLLPNPDNAAVVQPNNAQRYKLGQRLEWLFDQGLLPNDLRDLADCVRDDGNDGAHAGNLIKEDVEDLLDFTAAFLERLITEPKKIELAAERRKARRDKGQ